LGIVSVAAPVAAFLLIAARIAPAFASPCADISEDDISYSVCRFDPKTDDLRLFWRGPDGRPYGNFDSLASTLKSDGERLIFAMNGGMYNTSDAPIGLYIEHGVELHRANTRNGPGNFHMKPNGVFFVGGGRAGVWETTHFLKAKLKVDYATQSGPMLVLDGKIHPRIRPDGVSAKLRNGVGVDREGEAVFAISNQPVTFYQFATLFRDRLHCPNALFLDGSVSSLYAPDLLRDDFTMPMGPIVGVVEKVERSD